MWNVLGQQRLIDFMEGSIARDRLSHAYLMVGPRHVGKMHFALTLARRLNCEAPDGPCGSCPACLRIAQGKHPDVQVIRLARDQKDKQRKEIGIDQIKAVRESCSVPPFQGKRKVFIIEDAEWLSAEAANALLKILEEPPGYVVFVLLTENDRAILPTVLSRCQRCDLATLPAKLIEEMLVRERGVEADRAKLVAGLARGRIGWALEAVKDETLLSERSSRAEALVKVASLPRTRRFDFANQLAMAYQSDKEGVRSVLSFWTAWWRDLLLVKLDCVDLIGNIDMKAGLSDMATRVSLAQVMDFLKVLQTTSARLEMNASPRLLFDVMMLRMPQHSQLATRSG